MKRFLKSLAVMLAMTLVIGVIPVSAATVSLKAPSKAIYVDGCTGAKTNGTKAKYYSYLSVTKLLKNYDSKTMTVKLSTSDKSVATVNQKTLKVKAKSIGTATITVKVYNGAVKAKNLILNTSFDVTVKKNATASDLAVSGITSGQSYKVGDTVKVSLPVSTDSDKRRLTGSDNVTVKSTGTNKWEVTFNKAGAFTLTAEAYMNATYQKATASKVITGTVVGAKEDETPASKLSITQTAVNAFTISGLTSDLTKEKLSLFTLTGTVKINKASLINTITNKDGVATVTMFANLDADVDYYAAITGIDEELTFKGASCKLKDVAKLVVTTNAAKVNIAVPLEVSYFTESGIDITSAVKSEASSSTLYSLESGSESAILSAGQITFFAADKTAVVKAVLTTGYDSKTYEPIQVTGYGTIVSYEDKFDGTAIYSCVEDDSVYLTTKDKVVHTFAKNDAVYLEALFHFTDNTYRTFKETGYTLQSSDQAVVMVGSQSATGGYSIVPIKAGTVKLMVYSGSTFITAFEVTVGAERSTSTFKVEASKTTLNTNSVIGDFLTIKATAYDQYGAEYPSATFTVKQREITKTTTGTVSPLAFTGSNCIIYGSYVTKTGTSDVITLEITCDAITNSPVQVVSFTIKDVALSSDVYATANTRMVVEGASTIDTILAVGTQKVESTFVTADFYKDGYFVDETVGQLLTSAPTPALTCTQLGVADGTEAIYCTISLNGTIINPGTINTIDYDPYSPYTIEFIPITVGEKLAKGVYTVSVYKIKAGTSSSQIVPLGSTSISVVDSTPELSYERIDITTTGTLPGCLTNCFKFYYDGALITSPTITSAKTTTGSGSSVYVESVTISLPNTVYGTFSATIPVGELITVK